MKFLQFFTCICKYIVYQNIVSVIFHRESYALLEISACYDFILYLVCSVIKHG